MRAVRLRWLGGDEGCEFLWITGPFYLAPAQLAIHAL